jgi:predicted DNA-binding protein
MVETIRCHLDDIEDLYLSEQRLLDARAGQSGVASGKGSAGVAA